MNGAASEGLNLADLMQVTAAGQPGVFTGRTEAYGALGIYGGHFVGQALAAGFATVDEPKLAHSFHAYFLKRGDPDARLDYHVTNLRSSRAGDVRSIAARQNGDDVFHMLASFKLTEGGDEHQPAAPDVRTADDLAAAREVRGEPIFPFPIVQGGRAVMEWATPSFMAAEPGREPMLRNWMRVPGIDGLDARMRQVVLAFLSDGTLMFNAVLPYGLPFRTHRLTSLDHAGWFHRPADPGQWLLYDQRSTAAADGRGLNSGEIFTADGALVMSCVQESMLRRIDPAPAG
jgi:acyl-CoA thioesterase-2